VLPEDAGHSNFNLRFALSPILEKGLFSSFPGADRVITLIEGQGLNLEFEDQTVNLNPHDSLYFDTGLMPIGEPVGGPVQVVNVMVRRDVWKIETCHVVTELDISCAHGEIIFLCALSENFSVSVGTGDKTIPRYDSLIITDKCTLKTMAQDRVLYAHIKPSKIRSNE
jgi:environmental stress-induced protein Ves